MALPDPDQPSLDPTFTPAIEPASPTIPAQGTELAQALIDRKEAGEDVDDAIQALLDDMERLGLTGSDAYLMLDAYRPGVAEVVPAEEVEESDGPATPIV